MKIPCNDSKITSAVWGPLGECIIAGHEGGELNQYSAKVRGLVGPEPTRMIPFEKQDGTVVKSKGWIQIQISPLPSCVILGKLHNFPEPVFYKMFQGSNDIRCLKNLSQSTQDMLIMITIKHFPAPTEYLALCWALTTK